MEFKAGQPQLAGDGEGKCWRVEVSALSANGRMASAQIDLPMYAAPKMDAKMSEADRIKAGEKANVERAEYKAGLKAKAVAEAAKMFGVKTK